MTTRRRSRLRLGRRGRESDEITTLIDWKATKVDVENALRYGPKLNDSLLVVFWAGHGYSDSIDGSKLFLACHDTEVRKPGSGIRMSDLRSWLREREARNVVLIADACHAEGLAMGRGLGVRPAFEKESVPRGWLYLFASHIGDKAAEHPGVRGGLFTTSLVEALGGQADGYGKMGRADNQVTMGEVEEYVRAKVREKATKLHLTGAFDISALTDTADKDIWNLTLNAE